MLISSVCRQRKTLICHIRCKTDQVSLTNTGVGGAATRRGPTLTFAIFGGFKCDGQFRIEPLEWFFKRLSRYVHYLISLADGATRKAIFTNLKRVLFEGHSTKLTDGVGPCLGEDQK